MPLLRHSGIGGPCEMVRERRVRDTRGRIVRRRTLREYSYLTRASAHRLALLSRAGAIRLVRDPLMEITRSMTESPIAGFRQTS